MAHIYTKTSDSITEGDKTLIIPGREALLYPFDLGDWTELRIGFSASITLGPGDNTNPTGETINSTSPQDRFFGGLKNSSNNILPGFAGSTFCGIVGNSGALSYLLQGTFHSKMCWSTAAISGANHFSGWTNDTTVDLSTDRDAWRLNSSASTVGTSGYQGFIALKIVITDKGTATQQLTFYINGTQSTLADTSITALRSFLSSTTWLSFPGSSNYFIDGGVALPIPDAVYFPNPYTNHMFRIHCLVVQSYA